MDARTLARWMVILSNVLLGASLLLVLVWWAASLQLFVLGWTLYGVAYLLGRSVAVENAALAMPDEVAEPL